MNISDEKFVDLALGIRIFSTRECFMYIIMILHCWVHLVRQIPTWNLDKCKCHAMLRKNDIAVQ